MGTPAGAIVPDDVTRGQARPARRTWPGRFWPTEIHEWLLRLALGSAAEARTLWQQRDPHLAPGELDQGSLRLLPLVRWNVAPVLDAHELADPLLAAAADLDRASHDLNEGLIRDAEVLARELTRAGTDVLLLKGAALLLTSYPAFGLRPMVDLDMLVPADAVPQVVAVLERHGWTPRHRLTPNFLRTRHAMPFKSTLGRRCDLHWVLFEEHCPPGLDAACWTAARVVDLRGTPVRVLAPTDQLLHVVIHGMRWARTPSIRWVADAVLVLRGEGIDWARLTEQARA